MKHVNLLFFLQCPNITVFTLMERSAKFVFNRMPKKHMLHGFPKNVSSWVCIECPKITFCTMEETRAQSWVLIEPIFKRYRRLLIQMPLFQKTHLDIAFLAERGQQVNLYVLDEASFRFTSTMRTSNPPVPEDQRSNFATVCKTCANFVFLSNPC